jgi:hypothetical protein
MTLVAATTSFSTAHTVAFVTLRGDGMISVRFSGPAASGVASLPWDAPLNAVKNLLRDACGPSDGGELIATFVPAPGSTASTVDEIHAEHNYTVLVRTHRW